MMDLQSLMDSWSLEDNRPGAQIQQQIDDLAERLRDRLEIDLGREQFRDLAAKLIQLNIEKRQTGASIGSSASSQIPTRPAPTSTSTWHSPGQENSYGATTARSANLQTLFDPPPPAPPAAQRGRPRERQQSLPHSTPRSSTPVRSFFGFGAKSPPAPSPGLAPNSNANVTATTANNQAAPTQPTRTRSRSPFRLFARSGQKQEGLGAAVEEEKKEHDIFATTCSAAAKTPARGVPRRYSGRASPTLDPSANKPAQPARARSPFNNARGDSPVPSRPQATPHRPASPFPHGRPGLQDDDDESGHVFSRMPVQRATTTDDLDSNTFDAAFRDPFEIPRSASNRPNHGAEQDDDEAGQQPRPRHRKSLSEPMVFGNLDFDPSDFAALQIKEAVQTSQSKADPINKDETKPHPFVATSVEPPQQQRFRTPPAAVDPKPAVFKTAAGKNRRKGGTPPFAATATASRFFADGSACAPPVGSRASTQPPSFHASGAAFGQNSLSTSGNLAFVIGVPPVGVPSKVRGPQKRVFRRPSPVNQSTHHTASQTQHAVPSPPSPMEIDPMEATPPPKANGAIQQPAVGVEFSMGLNIPRKHPTPIRNKTRPAQLRRPEGHQAASADDGLNDALDPRLVTKLPVDSPVMAPPFSEKPLAPTQEEKRGELVSMLRDEARKLYVAQDFAGSIVQWTKAIKLFDGIASSEANDTFSVLLSNRAACFLMIEAFEPAIKDCIEALLHVSDSSSAGSPFSHDSGLPLRVRVLVRLGKAYLKHGDHRSSIQTLDLAIEAANKGLVLAPAILLGDAVERGKSLLNQMITEATLTKSDARRLTDLCQSISACVATIQGRKSDKNDERMYLEALGWVKSALALAGGSVVLFENKVMLLASLKRWREIASFLERLACSRVSWDSVFHEVELETHNPLPGVPRAKFLSASAFGSVDETDEEEEVKLNSKACGEAVLRLPSSLTQTYLRALRLEERYPSAEAALKSLEELVERGHHAYSSPNMQAKFSWLSREYIKLNRTKKGREYGDKLFRLQDYELAAKEYGKCLAIDAEDSGAPGIGTAGGRLHAVLYCNRAACFMALQRYPDALDECAAALRIHPRYMKALLRRARCYSRLSRCEEAIREYNKWRELAVEGKESPKSSSGGSACWFDLPREVTSSDMDMVMKELDEVHIMKRRQEAAAREAANRRNEQRRWQDNMHSHSFGGATDRQNSSAHQRRQDWHNQQSGSRYWDSFSGRNPRSGPSASNSSTGQHGHNRSRSWNNGPNAGGSHSAHQRSNIGSPGSDLSISHYTVLGIDVNATARDIKKAYRAKALTEHPDKNIHDPNAADKFRRIQMAYEVLSDAQTRYRYDLEQGYRRR